MASGVAVISLRNGALKIWLNPADQDIFMELPLSTTQCNLIAYSAKQYVNFVVSCLWGDIVKATSQDATLQEVKRVILKQPVGQPEASEWSWSKYPSDPCNLRQWESDQLSFLVLFRVIKLDGPWQKSEH